MRTISNIRIILFLLCSTCFIRCYSIKFKNTFAANDLRYPVSMNKFIHNESLKVVDHYNYTIIDHFSFKIRRYYLSFGIPISSGEADLSNKINSLVHKKGGDGVVNFALYYNEKFGGKYYFNGPLPYMLVFLQLGTPACYLYASKIKGFRNNFLGYIAGMWVTTLTIEFLFPKVYTIDVEGDIIKFN